MQRGRAEGEEGSSQSPANRSHRLPSETVTGITLTATPAPPKGEGRHQSDPRLFSASKGRSPLATPRRSERRAHRSAVLRPSYPVKKPVKKPIVCKKIGHLIGFLSLDPEGPGLGKRPPARPSCDRAPTTSPIGGRLSRRCAATFRGKRRLARQIGIDLFAGGGEKTFPRHWHNNCFDIGKKHRRSSVQKIEGCAENTP